MYGFAHFSQRKDASSKRGYAQVGNLFILRRVGRLWFPSPSPLRVPINFLHLSLNGLTPLQRSLVILTHHSYPALFARITALLGPLFQEHGLPMLEAACHNIATWYVPPPSSHPPLTPQTKKRSDPTPGMNTELGFLGTVISVELPLSPEQQQLAGKAYDPRQHVCPRHCILP